MLDVTSLVYIVWSLGPITSRNDKWDREKLETSKELHYDDNFYLIYRLYQETDFSGTGENVSEMVRRCSVVSIEVPIRKIGELGLGISLSDQEVQRFWNRDHGCIIWEAKIKRK